MLASVRLAVLLLFALACAGPFAPAGWAQARPGQTGPGVGEKSSPINAVPAKREQDNDSNEAFRHSKAVVKLGSMVGLGPEAAATAFTLLNFLVLAAGIAYLALKTLPGKFKDRGSAIQKSLVEARTATEDANARLKAVENRLSKLDSEIANMRQQVEADTARDEERIKVSIEEESAKILAAAEAEIQAATVTARRDLQRHAAELAIEQAARRLEVTAEMDRLLVQGFAQRLAGDKGGQN